jgi:hypothetical protein
LGQPNGYGYIRTVRRITTRPLLGISSRFNINSREGIKLCIKLIEAISKSGVIELLEPIEFEENEPLVVLRLSKKWTAPETNAASKDWRAFSGQLKSSPTFEGDPVYIQQEMRNE